jgi:hypothetical protein
VDERLSLARENLSVTLVRLHSQDRQETLGRTARRLLAGLLGLVLVLVWLSAAARGATSPHENIPLGSEPSSCANEASLECERWVIGRLDAARGDLGLPAYALPADFTSLSADRQLFILTDLDRTSYGDTAVYGLNTNLSEAAQAGVREARDPTPPAAGGPWKGFGSDWASTGALIGYYLWMYDDGYGGPNGDCTSPSAAGCWGHRRVILGEAVSLPQPQLMGAAAGAAARNGGSALIISSNGSTGAYYTWAQAQKEGAGGGEGEEPHSPVEVRVTVSGEGTVKINGTVCSGTCSQTVPYGTAVKLRAVPAKGYRFTGWSGSCSGKKQSCNLVADSAVSVAASFAAKPAKAPARDAETMASGEEAGSEA